MKLRLTSVLLFLVFLPAAAQSFYTDGHPFIEIDDPIDVGMERFSSRLDAVGSEREPLGLILSGGSARAFAHIGVLAAMEEAGVRPDFIVANSMGAIVALLYAAGYSPASIERLLEGTSLSSLFEPVIPVHGGLMSASDFKAAISSLIGKPLDISELEIPIIILCEDVRTRRQVRLAEGDFTTVMTAAFALPAFFEPVPFRGLTLIDGGVTNLVPVAEAYEWSSKVIAAATLYDPKLGFGNPVVVLARAMDISKTRRAVEELEAFRPVIVRCHVEDQSFMGFDRPQELIGRGRTSAKAVMEDILALARDGLPPAVSETVRKTREEGLERFLSLRSRNAVDPKQGIEFAVKPLVRFAAPAESLSPYVRNELYAGAGASVESGRTELDAGVIFRPFDGAYPLGSLVGFRIAPANLAVLRAEAEAAFAPGSRAWNLTGTGEVSSFIPPVAGRPFVTGFRAGVAVRTDDTFALDWTASAGAEVVMGGQVPAETARFEVRPGLSAGWMTDSAGNYGPYWNAKLQAGFPGRLEARARYAGRWSAWGPGTALLEGDAYRGTTADPPDGTHPFTAVANLELSVGSGRRLWSLAELAVVRSVSAAFYLDGAFPGSGPATTENAYTAGIDVSADISLLGLKPLEISSFAGVSLDGLTPCFGLRMGRLFAQ